MDVNAFALLAGQRTHSQAAGSSPGWQNCVVALGKLLTPCAMSNIIWYRPKTVISLAGKVTAGLMESNGSLP